MDLEESSSVGRGSISVARQVRRGREEPCPDVCRPRPDLVAEQSTHTFLRDVLCRVDLAGQPSAVTDQVRIVLLEDLVEIDRCGRWCGSYGHVIVY